MNAVGSLTLSNKFEKKSTIMDSALYLFIFSLMKASIKFIKHQEIISVLTGEHQRLPNF